MALFMQRQRWAGYGVLMGVQRVCSSAFADGVEPTTPAGPVKIVKFADDGTSLGASNRRKVRKSQRAVESSTYRLAI